MKVSFFESDNSFQVRFNSSEDRISVKFDSFIGTSGEPYEGPYTFTPTQSTQIVLSKSKTLSDNITINPIPSNYGLITFSGFELTVS